MRVTADARERARRFYMMKRLDQLRERIKRYRNTHNFTCDLCGREVFENERVCAQCLKMLPWNHGEVCPFCGRRVKEAGACVECKQKPLQVQKARSVFLHEGEAARLVRGFKGGKKYFYRTCAELSAPLFKNEFADTELITCVPMTERAEKRRGYNQSRLFAEELSRLVGTPYLETAVKRRETQSQRQLSRTARESNLEGCFHVIARKEVAGKRVLIADDTLTTGATVSELAAALKRAGAKTVYALTVTGVENKTPFGKPPKK